MAWSHGAVALGGRIGWLHWVVELDGCMAWSHWAVTWRSHIARSHWAVALARPCWAVAWHGCMARSHCSVAWRGHIARLHGAVTLLGCMARSHCSVAWRGHIARLHGAVTLLGCMARSHCTVAWRGHIARLHGAVTLLGCMARSHCTVAWRGHIARLHGAVTLHGCMARSHCTVAWRGHIARLHGAVTLHGCMVQLHWVVTWCGCMARSHCMLHGTVAWRGRIGWLHGTDALDGRMVLSHWVVAWHGCIGWSHGTVALGGRMVLSHWVVAWHGCIGWSVWVVAWHGCIGWSHGTVALGGRIGRSHGTVALGGRMARLHWAIAWHGCIGRSHGTLHWAVAWHGCIGRSHGTVALGGRMARSHGTVALGGRMAWSHWVVTWHGHIVRLLGTERSMRHTTIWFVRVYSDVIPCVSDPLMLCLFILLASRPNEPDNESWGFVHPRLLSVPELCHYAAEAWVSLTTFLRNLLLFKAENPGKFCLLVCGFLTFLTVLGGIIPGLVLSYLLLLFLLLWPLAIYHRLGQRLYQKLEPALQRLDFSVRGYMMARQKERQAPGRALPSNEASDSEEELAAFCPTLDDSVVAKELTISDSEHSDAEVSYTENGTFNLSRGQTPLTEGSEDLDRHSDPEESFARDLPDFPSINPEAIGIDDEDEASIGLPSSANHPRLSSKQIFDEQGSEAGFPLGGFPGAQQITDNIAGLVTRGMIQLALAGANQPASSFLENPRAKTYQRNSSSELDTDAEADDFELLDQSELSQMDPVSHRGHQ
uniref:RETREG1-3/ARL6IP-like N-terminal reticulon-homology domain-containing protein n=1 Tax=Leptobrachium leishanense TaxID=445787 RepID=A0A8C5ML12_9ANUR